MAELPVSEQVAHLEALVKDRGDALRECEAALAREREARERTEAENEYWRAAVAMWIPWQDGVVRPELVKPGADLYAALARAEKAEAEVADAARLLREHICADYCGCDSCERIRRFLDRVDLATHG